MAGARPRTLPAAISPVLVGTALIRRDHHSINYLNATLALLVSLLLQVAVNYSNDYSDGIRGTDDNRVGPVRLVASGLASARAVKQAAFICFATASALGAILAIRVSWWLVLVGVWSQLSEVMWCNPIASHGRAFWYPCPLERSPVRSSQSTI